MDGVGALDLVVDSIERLGRTELAYAMAKANGWEPAVLREILRMRDADREAIAGGAPPSTLLSGNAMADYYRRRARSLAAQRAGGRVRAAIAGMRTSR